MNYISLILNTWGENATRSPKAEVSHPVPGGILHCFGGSCGRGFSSTVASGWWGEVVVTAAAATL